MTCIVGLKTSAGIWMGCDSLVTDGSDSVTASEKKVFRKGDLLIGVSGSVRFWNILQTSLPAFEVGAIDEHEYLVDVFVRSVRSALREGGALSKEDGLTDAEGDMLVAVRGRLFMVGSDMSVLEPEDDWAATGTGFRLALGSMYSTKSEAARGRVWEALDVACRFDVACGGDKYMEFQEWPESNPAAVTSGG